MSSGHHVPRSLEGIRLLDPVPGVDTDLAPRPNLFVRAWRGKASLAMVWWGIGLPLRIVGGILNANWAFERLYGGNEWARFGVACATVAASVVWSVMAWRCAPNVEDRLWMWVARGLIIVMWMQIAYELVRIGLAVLGATPR